MRDKELRTERGPRGQKMAREKEEGPQAEGCRGLQSLGRKAKDAVSTQRPQKEPVLPTW